MVISTSNIPEFHQVKVTDTGLWCGAAVTIAQLEVELRKLIQTEEKSKTKIMVALDEILEFYACTQIKNIAVSHTHYVYNNTFTTKLNDSKYNSSGQC